MFYALQFKVDDKYKTVCVQYGNVDEVFHALHRNGYQGCEYRILEGTDMEEVIDKITGVN